MSRAVRAVYFVFLLWVPIETIDFFQKQGPSRIVSISRLLGLLLVLLALIDWRGSLRRLPPELWAIVWYLFAFCASQMWLPAQLDQDFLKKQLVLIYSVAIFLVSVNFMEEPGRRGSALRSYGWLAGGVALAMLLGAFGPPSEALEGRGTILGQDPNVTAGLFAAGAICVAGDPSLTQGRGIWRMLLAPAAVCVLILGILETGSRGGLLALVSGIVGLAACGGKLSRGRRAFIAVALVGALGLLVRREFQNRTTTATRLQSSLDDGDTAGRNVIYAAAWKMFREKPLLGWGGERNNFVLGRRLDYSVSNVFERDTHNLALEVLTSVGLVGGVPLLGVILFAWGKAWLRGRRTGDALPFALLCAQLTSNMSLTGLNQTLFWIVLAAAVASDGRRACASAISRRDLSLT